MHYNLVCELSWTKSLGQSVFMIGALLGSVIFGYLSDKYGRQKTFFISIMIMTFSGCLTALMPDYWYFIAARAVIGATTSGVFLVAFVLGLELVGPKYRKIAGISIQFFFTFGYFLTSLIAYFVWDWRIFQTIISLPGIIFITYLWCIPESARWLMTQLRYSEAEEIITKAAKTNNIVLPEHLFEDVIVLRVNTPHVKKPNFMDLFKRPDLCKGSLNILFNWFVNSLVYYGLSLNTGNLGGNPYLTFAIAGSMEVPAYIMCIMIMDKIGRRLSLCACMMVGGVSLMTILLIPDDNINLIIAFAMLGKFAISGSYALIYVFSAELFPTPVRNIGVGLSSLGARIGGIIAPFFLLLGDIEKWLPNFTFGALALIAGVLALFLPETNKMSLPETMAEGERFSKSSDKYDKVSNL